MANQEQLKRLLDDGVEAWNRWRKANPGVEVDLSSADLSSTNLSYADFSNAKLRNAKLNYTNLRYTDLRNGDFRNGDLSSAHLFGADLRSANLFDADLHSAYLRYANLSYANLRFVNLFDADLISAQLRSANLDSADLSNADLSNANLSNAELRSADLSNADLRYANLFDADLSSAKLFDARLNSAILSSVNLDSTNLSSANLSSADLRSAHLFDTELRYADLSNADLRYAKLISVNLSNSNLDAARFSALTISNVKLLDAIGLDKIKHTGPSDLSHWTLQHFQNQLLPEVFLKGCGLSTWEILSAKLHNPKLKSNQIIDIRHKMNRLHNKASLQMPKLFISYSHGDARFVDHIEKLFDANDVRYWRDVRDSTGGPIEKTLDHAISYNPVMLLILSANSLKSQWVVLEIEKAIKIEKEEGRDVIYPIALDDAWEKEGNLSPILLSYIRNKYIVLDFSGWKDPTFLKTQFTKLLTGLHLFYTEGRKEE